MALTIDFPPDLEQSLREQAASRGQTLEEYVRLALTRAAEEELAQQTTLPGLDLEA